jgi:hypothetical protein
LWPSVVATWLQEVNDRVLAVLLSRADFFPAPQELKTNFFEYNYTLSLVAHENDYRNSESCVGHSVMVPLLIRPANALSGVSHLAVTESLMKELICQRQAQDYQICVVRVVVVGQQLFFRARLKTHNLASESCVHFSSSADQGLQARRRKGVSGQGHLLLLAAQPGEGRPRPPLRGLR